MTVATSPKGDGGAIDNREKLAPTHFLSTCSAVVNALTPLDLPSCVLRPHPEAALFVAWNGVLVLVYEGFPEPLHHAKTFMNDIPHLIPENFGSKWPKTTLAALGDNAAEFTLKELESLRQICQHFSSLLCQHKVEIPVSKISLVDYKCRSLERITSQQDLALDTATVSRVVSKESVSIVDGVIGEWQQDPERYLPKVNAPGSRIGSYRTDAHGCTSIVFLKKAFPDALRQRLDEFRTAINTQFPGRYEWIEETALHCTLRCLDQQSPDPANNTDQSAG